MVTSSTSVTVSVAIPPKSKTDPNSIEYSRLALIYSSDPCLQDSRKILIDLEDHSSISRRTTVKSNHGERASSPEKDTGAEKETEEKTVVRKVKVTNLESGKFYFFQLIAGIQDVDGPPTDAESIFVDGLPQAPPKPMAVVDFDNNCITIFSDLGSTTGSPIQSYRLYHSVDSNMESKFLIDEISSSNLKLESGKIKFVFSNPELRLSHYFNVTAVNMMGESLPSEISDKCVIGNINRVTVLDYAPSQPSKPIIKKLSGTSLQISSQITPNGGSDVDFFTISIFKSNEDSEEKIKTSSEILYGTHLEHVIDGLELETSYEFQVIARNGVGPSSPSEKSDKIRLGIFLLIIILDALVPIAESPQILILNPTSVKIILPNISFKKPIIKEFRISWSPTTDFQSDLATTITCPSNNSFYILEDLPECQSFYFGICLIGESSGNLFYILI